MPLNTRLLTGPTIAIWNSVAARGESAPSVETPPKMNSVIEWAG